jgi:hypothetical protein
MKYIGVARQKQNSEALVCRVVTAVSIKIPMRWN